MKRVVATFEVKSDLEEHKIVTHLESIGCTYLKILGDTSHLKENTSFKELRKLKKVADDSYYKFINQNRE